jgi:hypothetical protein
MGDLLDRAIEAHGGLERWHGRVRDRRRIEFLYYLSFLYAQTIDQI